MKVEPSDIYQTLEQSSLEVSTKKIEQGMDSEDRKYLPRFWQRVSRKVLIRILFERLLRLK